MTAFTVQAIPHAGATITYTAPAAGAGANTAPCGNGIGLLVQNASGAPITLTIPVPAAKSFDGLVVPARTQTIAAGADGLIPLVDATYTDPATGLCTWGVSSVTSVTAAVISIGA